MALLVAWSLAVWGTLLLVVTGWASLTEGPGPALGRLLPSPGASLWTWLNAWAAALALVAWAVAAGLFFQSRRLKARQPDPPVGS